MLEFNGSFIANLIFWFMLIVFLLATMLVGFSAIEYQRFNTAVQETLERTGTFHVPTRYAKANYPWVINNPQLLKIEEAYGFRWMVEPVPNLTAYDASTLVPRGVHAVIPPSEWGKVNLSDFEHENGTRKVGKVTGAYFYDKLALRNVWNGFHRVGEDDYPSKADCDRVAAAYNAGQDITDDVKPQYLDLSDYDAEELVNKIDSRRKNMPYNPSKENSYFNGLKMITNTRLGKTNVYGYVFSTDNPWTKLTIANRAEPHVKYASQVAYMIVPNRYYDGRDNWPSMKVGTWRFVLNTGIFNSRGKVQLVTNQIRSIGNAKTASDMGSLGGGAGSGGSSSGSGGAGWKPLMT